MGSLELMPAQLHFTDSAEANRLITMDPMALLVGFALDQQITVQTAFLGPLKIVERIGTLDAAGLAVPRSPAAMAERVHDLAVYVRDEYGGDAAAIWRDATSPEDLRARIAALP